MPPLSEPTPPSPGASPGTSQQAAAFTGKYQLVRKLADGGMGAVWEALEVGGDRRVAVKLVHPHVATDERAVQRFLREAEALLQLEHPNAVKLFDFGTDGARPYLAMELLPGQSAAQTLAATGPLPLTAVAAIADQTLSVLEAAHRLGIIHRDLKPANLMLEVQGEHTHVKVVDFGVATIRRADARPLTQSGTMVGTASYMSPEQCRGERCDATTDLYALACTLFELLTGRPPFHAKTAAEVMAGHLYQVPPLLEPSAASPTPLDRALQRALSKRPSERYASASEMRAALATAFSSTDPGTEPPTGPRLPEASVGVLTVSPEAQGDKVHLALAAAGLGATEVTSHGLPEHLAVVVVLGSTPPPVLDAARAVLARAPATQVVMVCDAGDFQVLREALACGVFAVVALPLDPVELVKNVARALRRPRRSS